ncbi:MAG: hypothetical protein AAGI01_18535, partial [Myxococcota bacterium]
MLGADPGLFERAAQVSRQTSRKGPGRKRGWQRQHNTAGRGRRARAHGVHDEWDLRTGEFLGEDEDAGTDVDRYLDWDWRHAYGAELLLVHERGWVEIGGFGTHRTWTLSATHPDLVRALEEHMQDTHELDDGLEVVLEDAGQHLGASLEALWALQGVHLVKRVTAHVDASCAGLKGMELGGLVKRPTGVRLEMCVGIDSAAHPEVVALLRASMPDAVTLVAHTPTALQPWDALLQLPPTVRTVRIAREARPIGEAPRAAAALQDSDCAMVASVENPHLRTVSFDGAHAITPRAIASLVASPNLPNLTAVHGLDIRDVATLRALYERVGARIHVLTAAADWASWLAVLEGRYDGVEALSIEHEGDINALLEAPGLEEFERLSLCVRA